MEHGKVVIVDYGIGNLFSVRRAFEVCGAEPELSSDRSVILDADRLVLPGVGAFADGMDGLRKLDLIEPIRRYAKTGKPFLGICLGMQMMMDRSYEFGEYEGLGLISGDVQPIPRQGSNGIPHKIPHVGWSELRMSQRNGAGGTILDNITEGSAVYFVHSYAVVPSSVNDRLANTTYDGLELAAVIGRGRMFGCQFHPERSGAIGLTIIQNFCRV